MCVPVPSEDRSGVSPTVCYGFLRCQVAYISLCTDINEGFPGVGSPD